MTPEGISHIDAIKTAAKGRQGHAAGGSDLPGGHRVGVQGHVRRLQPFAC